MGKKIIKIIPYKISLSGPMKGITILTREKESIFQSLTVPSREQDNNRLSFLWGSTPEII